MDNEQEEINPGHYHELMDRSYMIAEIIESHLIMHPAAQKHPEIKEKLEKAQSLIYEVYQEVGAKDLNMEEHKESVKSSTITEE